MNIFVGLVNPTYRLSNGDEKLYLKTKKLAKELKSGKRNPLKNKEKFDILDTSDEITPSELEYVFHEIDTNISKEEKAKGEMYRRLYNRIFNRDFIYYIKYDKTGNGRHIIERYYINDDIY